jgi:hypothetical protein
MRLVNQLKKEPFLLKYQNTSLLNHKTRERWMSNNPALMLLNLLDISAKKPSISSLIQGRLTVYLLPYTLTRIRLGPVCVPMTGVARER